MWKETKNNPHLPSVVTEPLVFDSEPVRILVHKNAPTLPFRELPEYTTLCAWGQRRQLVSHMQVINLFRKKVKLVLFAGCAQGKHITFLSQMFPDLDFVAYDHVKFNIASTNKIQLFNKQFTTEDVRFYLRRATETIFISDEKQDMGAQLIWHETLKPLASFLKFRLPFTPGETRYLKGDLYFHVWGPHNSPMTNLLVTGHEMVDYDNKIYESEMQYYKEKIRPALYSHSVEPNSVQSNSIESSHYCHCYDCATEIALIKKHLEINADIFNQPWDILSDNEKNKAVLQMCEFFGTLAPDRKMFDPCPEKQTMRSLASNHVAHVTGRKRKIGESEIFWPDNK